MTISAAPSSGAFPYGIQVNSEGVPWYVDFWGNRLGSVDPKTARLPSTSFRIPTRVPGD